MVEATTEVCAGAEGGLVGGTWSERVSLLFSASLGLFGSEDVDFRGRVGVYGSSWLTDVVAGHANVGSLEEGFGCKSASLVGADLNSGQYQGKDGGRVYRRHGE